MQNDKAHTPSSVIYSSTIYIRASTFFLNKKTAKWNENHFSLFFRQEGWYACKSASDQSTQEHPKHLVAGLKNSRTPGDGGGELGSVL